MIRRTCAAITLAIALNATPVGAQWNHPLPYGLYVRLAQCETGANLQHLTRTYVGQYGFTKAVWRMYSSTPVHRAGRLTFAQQSRVLDRAFFFGYGPRYAVGPWGHGCWKRLWKTDANLRTAVCNNPKHAVRRWCRP